MLMVMTEPGSAWPAGLVPTMDPFVAVLLTEVG